MSDDREANYVAKIEQLEKENALLREKLDLVLRRMFGAKSEKLDAKQLELLLGSLSKKDEPAGGTAPALKEKPSTTPLQNRAKRPRLPEHLPVEEEVVIPLEVQAEPEAWREMGEEVTEQLDYRPARYFRKRLIRKKFVSVVEPQRAPVIAPLPRMLQERCLAAPSMIAHVITAKYCDHLPLYRQEDILWRRHKIPLPRQTMMGWLDLAEFWLGPIYELIKTTESLRVTSQHLTFIGA